MSLASRVGLAAQLAFQPAGHVTDDNDAARHDDSGRGHDAGTHDECDAALIFAVLYAAT